MLNKAIRMLFLQTLSANDKKDLHTQGLGKYENKWKVKKGNIKSTRVDMVIFL